MTASGYQTLIALAPSAPARRDSVDFRGPPLVRVATPELRRWCVSPIYEQPVSWTNPHAGTHPQWCYSHRRLDESQHDRMLVLAMRHHALHGAGAVRTAWRSYGAWPEQWCSRADDVSLPHFPGVLA